MYICYECIRLYYLHKSDFILDQTPHKLAVLSTNSAVIPHPGSDYDPSLTELNAILDENPTVTR